jgi:hypothetical protein
VALDEAKKLRSRFSLCPDSFSHSTENSEEPDCCPFSFWPHFTSTEFLNGIVPGALLTRCAGQRTPAENEPVGAGSNAPISLCRQERRSALSLSSCGISLQNGTTVGILNSVESVFMNVRLAKSG